MKLRKQGASCVVCLLGLLHTEQPGRSSAVALPRTHEMSDSMGAAGLGPYAPCSAHLD